MTNFFSSVFLMFMLCLICYTFYFHSFFSIIIPTCTHSTYEAIFLNEIWLGRLTYLLLLFFFLTASSFQTLVSIIFIR